MTNRTNNFLLFLFLCLLTFSCTRAEKEKDTIKVGVFDRNGDSPYCIIDALEALRIDPQIECRTISASDIMSSELNNYDAILFPGGSGKSETFSLGEMGMQKIKQFVIEQGKAVVGICAGAYILTNTPNYPCLALSGAQAIDIEHDNRGSAIAKFSLSEEGIKIFPELINRDISYCQYYEGPVLVKAEGDISYTSLATMLSDVHTVEGSPKNMTNGRPFIISSLAGKGRTISFVGHPESTPGMRWMIPRAIRWTLNKELISYNKNVVNTYFYSREIIKTKEIKEKNRNFIKQLYGSEDEKINAMDSLIYYAYWSAKKIIPSMLRDNNTQVRLSAARNTVLLERTDAIHDLSMAIDIEENKCHQELLKAELKKLKALINR